MLRKAFIGAALAFLCLLPVSSDDVRIITLEEAIRSAAEHNLDIEYAKTELSSTLRIQDNVMSTFMPEISLRASVSPTVNFPTSSDTAISYDGLTVSAGADVFDPRFLHNAISLPLHQTGCQRLSMIFHTCILFH